MTQHNNHAAHRAAGVLLGLAAGDRNGGPTQMAVRLAEVILEKQGYHISESAESYLRWWQEEAFDAGSTTGSVLRKLDEGIPLDRAAAQVHRESGRKTAGCNPAHRASPLAAAQFLSDEQLERFAFLESTITHWDPLAGEAAVATVVLCRKLIQGLPWEEALREASFGRHFKINAALQSNTNDKLSQDGYAPNVLKAAVFHLQEHDHFEAALSASIHFAGPANYCPVLVGAIGGARWGASAVPKALLKHLSSESLPRLQAAAQQLSQTWSDRTLP